MNPIPFPLSNSRLKSIGCNLVLRKHKSTFGSMTEIVILICFAMLYFILVIIVTSR